MTLAIDIPQLPFWLLRLAAQPTLSPRFANNPVLFAAWYAPSASLVEWPAAVQAIQSAERGKKLNMERMSSMLSKVNYAIESGTRDMEYVRRILEGVAVHDWVSQHSDEFQECVEDAVQRFSGLYERIVKLSNSTFIQRTDELAQKIGLSTLEKELLLFGAACVASEEVRTILHQLDQSHRLSPKVFARIFDVDSPELAAALNEKSPLRLSGLLSTRGRVNRYPVLSDFWLRLLAETESSLAEVLTEPMVFRPTSGVPARLPAEDIELAAGLLANAQEPGVNLLLYGAGGLDKQGVLQELVHRAGLTAYRLAPLEDGQRELATMAFVAQRCLVSRDPNALLVLERPSDILEVGSSNVLAKLFGLDIEPAYDDTRSEMMLTSNPQPTIWLASNVSSLSQDTISRFVFHAALQKARREERRAQLEQMVASLDISKETQDALLALEDVSAIQLEAGVRAARLSGCDDQAGREAALVQAIRRGLKALERTTAPKAKECLTKYSLEFLNCGGRFGPAQVLKALQVRPRGSLCLYGLPGTGKTQYVEHIAHVLGKKLIAKRASDLLSKWVGESEQNIAAMFEEAANEEAILFLDEADSLLGERSRAQASWEVSKVNEMLQHMERFEGIFIVGTNLFEGLDSAALRRFTFKLQFNALSSDQRWEMFLNETGLRETLDQITPEDKTRWEETLWLMPKLCAGDFATVKRQCVLLGEVLSPEDWIEQLKLECEVKSRADSSSAPRMRA